MLQFCTMCDDYYNDASKHRYIECPYYNGCACGLKHQTKKHVDSCFMAREVRRKNKTLTDALAREEILKKKELPLIQNSQRQEELTCIYCFRKYSYSRQDHEARYCPYFIGCPFCGRKKIDMRHVDECKYQHLRAVEEEKRGGGSAGIFMVCQYCRADVPMDKWDAHRKEGCGPRGLALIVEETQKKEEPKIPTRWCPICDKDICLDLFESHQDGCKKRVAARYAVLPKRDSGEVTIVDDRPKSSNLKEVKFVEEP